MRKFKWSFLIFLTLTALGPGCSTQDIVIEGFVPKNATEAIPAQASFAVLTNPKVFNSVLDAEIAAKIEKMLRIKGYRVSPQESADFIVRYTYGIKGHDVTTVSFPDDYPFENPCVVRGFYGYGGYDPFISPDLGWVTEASETYKIYTSKLLIKIKDEKHYPANDPRSVIWIGESYIDTYRRDLRSSVDYLLAAMFQYFGADTGQSREIRIKPENPLLKELQSGSETAPLAS
ncbi:MAG TPA: DUF4136 domain-containing protein [Candidatus Omnitrophota bacterium]|nr:DUF4136 domain-containing protein [Candidatus Omnitrophota bacterium]